MVATLHINAVAELPITIAQAAPSALYVGIKQNAKIKVSAKLIAFIIGTSLIGANFITKGLTRVMQDAAGMDQIRIRSNLKESSPNCGNIKFIIKEPLKSNPIGITTIENTSIKRKYILPRRENCFIEEYFATIPKVNAPKHVAGARNIKVTLVAAVRSATAAYESKSAENQPIQIWARNS